ncbi:MAG TPA: SAM-dependent methyltransferase [Actinomycetales bacterium]|nr:SAM-dependent methyltransferase [Actinomycetales bacterium]
MPEDLTTALASLRPLLLDPQRLVRAVAAGRRRAEQPSVTRAELRPVDLTSGPHLQVVTTDGRQPTTMNAPFDDAGAVVDGLLAEPFGSWHVETVDETVQLRVTKKGAAQVHRAATTSRVVESRAHDRVKERLLDPADPLFAVLGADADKRRQVDAFLRQLQAGLNDQKRLRHNETLRVVDLGCGNAYLTFAAHRWLASGTSGGPRSVETVGVDVRPDMVRRNAELAERLGMSRLSFEVGSIVESRPLAEPPDVVLALHACDTATDEALARAVRWEAPLVLAAPCCHHDLQRQLAENRSQGRTPPEPYGALVRHAILRERFTDVLTDSLRALLLRMLGYRVDVVEFVDSRHTPRNAMIRAVRTEAPARAEVRQEYRRLTQEWQVRPALERLLEAEVAKALEA